MNALRSFTLKRLKPNILKRELSAERSLVPCRKHETCSSTERQSRRAFSRDTKNDKNDIHDAKELLANDKESIKMLQASGAFVRLPDSYFYMKVSENSRNLDCKPPGTHLKSGAIKNKPVGAKLGRLRALALVVALIYCGGQLSSLAARMLHEFEIFALPDDDDD